MVTVPVAVVVGLAVKTTEFTPLVMVTVWPLVGSPLKVPVRLAVVPRPGWLMAKAAKSLVQFGVAFTSKLNLAGYIIGATPPVRLPSVTLQSPEGFVGADPGFDGVFPDPARLRPYHCLK